MCPYCSTDMEPIELNGKTFCSNCGLTIGAAKSNFGGQPITNFPAPPDDLAKPVEAVTQLSDGLSETPIKDEAKQALGLNANDTSCDLINEIPDEPRQPVKLKVATEEPEMAGHEEPTINEPTDLPASAHADIASLVQEITGNSAEDGTDQATEEKTQPFIAPGPEEESLQEEQSLPVGVAESESRVSQIEIPSEKDFVEQPTPTTEPQQEDKSIEDKIKEVDTLGASGILLDILADTSAQSEREEKLVALEAAEEAMDSFPESVELQKKVADDFLEGKPQNPEEVLELPSPLDEPELPAPQPQDEVVTEPVHEEVPEKKKAAEDVTEVAETAIAVTPGDSELYQLPEKLTAKPEKKKRSSLFGKKKTAAEDKKTEEAIEAVEEEIEKIPEAKVDLTPEAASDFDPDTLPTLPEETAGIHQEDNKQAILAEYFKTKMHASAPSKKPSKHKGKDKKTKPSKSHTARSWMLPAILVSLILLIAVSGTIYYLLFYKTPAQALKTTSKEVGYSSAEPSYMIPGYSLTDTFTETENKTVTLEYTFATDTDAKIYLVKSRPADTEKYLNAESAKLGDNFVQKTVDGVDYTEVAENNLIWQSGNTVYILKTENYTLGNTLLYDIAKTIK